MGLGIGNGSGGNKGCGKPRQFDPAIAALYLEFMSEGFTVAQISQELNMPSINTVWDWTNGKHGAPPEFKNAYEVARRAQADSFANSTLDIARNLDEQELEACQAALDALPDDASDVQKRKAEFFATRRSVDCTKLMISTAQWAASRMNRPNWGSKVELQHSTDPANPPKFNFHDMTDEQLEKIAALEEELGDAGRN